MDHYDKNKTLNQKVLSIFSFMKKGEIVNTLHSYSVLYKMTSDRQGQGCPLSLVYLLCNVLTTSPFSMNENIDRQAEDR